MLGVNKNNLHNLQYKLTYGILFGTLGVIVGLFLSVFAILPFAFPPLTYALIDIFGETPIQIVLGITFALPIFFMTGFLFRTGYKMGNDKLNASIEKFGPTPPIALYVSSIVFFVIFGLYQSSTGRELALLLNLPFSFAFLPFENTYNNYLWYLLISFLTTLPSASVIGLIIDWLWKKNNLKPLSQNNPNDVPKPQ